MRSITVKAFAKLNLGLRILGRRPDGFHELRTIYQTISLCDIVEVSLVSSAKAGRVELAVEGLEVPAGMDNLAARAAQGMTRLLGSKKRVRIHLRKRIPTGGGLGGGSSDAAAVLRALDCLSGQRVDRAELLQLAASLGSDVPFFLFGGRAVGVGRGEEVYPLPDTSPRHYVVALPSEGMNTAEAYRLLNARAWPPASSAKLAFPTADAFMATLARECAAAPGLRVVPVDNDFEPIVFKRFPQLATARRTLLRCGAEWAALTGSGSAIFGQFEACDDAEAARVQMLRAGLRTYVCRTITRRQFLAGCRSN